MADPPAPAGGMPADPPDRTAQRKRARLHQPPPDRDAVYDHLALDDLRAMRRALAEEETRVSYWRRIIQARLDVVRAGDDGADAVRGLRTALTDSRSSHRRVAHVSVEPVEGLPPLPDLAELWDTVVDAADPDAVAALAARLGRAERELSQYRHELHARIDRVTRELIARYRENPLLALGALPREMR